MSLSKQKRGAPQKNSCSRTVILLPCSCPGRPFPHQVDSHLCMASPLLLHEPAGPSKRHKHGRLLREAHVQPHPQSGQMWLSPQQGPCVATSTGTNRHICLPSVACTGGRGGSASMLGAAALLGAGHGNHLAEFTASPKSASMHFSQAYSRLCLTLHTWACAGLGSGALCNIRSSICCLRCGKR